MSYQRINKSIININIKIATYIIVAIIVLQEKEKWNLQIMYGT